MMALEEKNFQSIKTDASLYNGLPTDTGTMCYSAEVTSSTPPSRNARMGGGAVENVLTENKQWFVLRVSYGRIFKAKTLVVGKGIKLINGA